MRAIGAGNLGYWLVVGVHDYVFALTEAGGEHLALPEGEGALALVALHAQVLGGGPARELVEPDEPALRRIDQRPVAARAGAVSAEAVARRRVGVRHGSA